jgi:hypothetical protein
VHKQSDVHFLAPKHATRADLGHLNLDTHNFALPQKPHSLVVGMRKVALGLIRGKKKWCIEVRSL